MGDVTIFDLAFVTWSRDSPVTDLNRKAHWETVYRTKGENEVSWFQENPAPSLELIEFARPTSQCAIVDIGGGASRLVDTLVAHGFTNVTVLDLSEAALASAKARLGDSGQSVHWVIADVTRWYPAQTYDIWHDRAAFHFLIDPSDRDAYVARLKQAMKPGGHAIIGTFARDGPERCSGLPVNRYDAASLGAALGGGFELVEARRHEHTTPWNSVQRFQFCVFRRSM
jgi:2-polyprenyl-3-methyl-5-hydroxy-6-metoxy-1,4-benzoquinol methylase